MSYTGSWVWDVHAAAPVYWSAEMYRIHGHDGVSGPPSIDAYRAPYGPESWSGWLAAVQKSVQDRTELDFDCRLVLSNGLVKEVRITGRPVAGVADKVTEIIGSTAEMNGLPRGCSIHTQTAEDPLLPVIDLIPGLVWSARRDGSLEYCNRVWLDYTGFTAERAMDWGWTEAIHSDDLTKVRQYWLSILETCKPGEIEARLRRFDGEYRWFLFRARPHLDNSGRVVKWYGTNTDIEDQKQAADSLRESELNFRLIVDTIPALVCTMTAKGEVELVNQQVLNYFGKTLEELKNWAFIGAVHEDDLDRVIAQWRHSVESGDPYDIEHRIRKADGVFRWFHVRGHPLRDSEDHIIRWYVLLTDIEDGNRARQALLKSQTRLARMSQIMTVAELSASIAHEVNQPLAAVLANAGACLTWLSGTPPNLERARATAEKIIRDTNSAAEVVRRMRALFRQTPPATVLSDMNDEIREVLSLIGNEFRDADIVVETQLQPDLPAIMVDHIQIQQTLINLMHNAIEAMQDVMDGPRRLSIVTQCDAVDILVQVSDSGCGISNPASIFDAFFTTKENGMGMGLAICRSIVEMHGGRLWAAANENAGTTFSFTLPLHPDVAI